MALGGCYSCIKYLMFAFNFIFWIIGCALLGLGIWIRVDKVFARYHHFEILYTAAYIMIAVGVVVMVIGFLGCCGAIRESPCMLGMFFVFLFIIFAALLGFGVWCIVEKETVKDTIADKIVGWVHTYQQKDLSKEIMDFIQHDFKCCGATSIANYPGDFEPPSCDEKYFEEGCNQKFIDWISDHILIIAVVAIIIAVVLVLGMIFSMVLCCAVRDSTV